MQKLVQQKLAYVVVTYTHFFHIIIFHNNKLTQWNDIMLVHFNVSLCS
jgi:TRAP-type uncharacterized transport system substrate-binding protein